MHIVLSSTSDVPLYEQIERHIRHAIYSGQLKEGEALPSLRELARDLQVSLITTTRAYNDLASEGIIGSRQGRSTVVLPLDHAQRESYVAQQIDAGFREAITAARLGGVPLAELHEHLDRLYEGEK